MSSGGVNITNRLRVPASALELEGFRRWAHSSTFPQRGKVSFISGEVHLEMSPEEIRTHNAAKRDVTNYLCHHVFRLDLGEVFADGVMLINEAAALATEPDAMFCSWETLESGRVKLIERSPGSGRLVELDGSPDLVVEVVSKTSVKKDKEELRSAYAQAGISEFWLIDARGAEIDFQVLILAESKYIPTVVDDEGFRPSRALGKQVRLTRELNRIGGWRYTLDIG